MYLKISRIKFPIAINTPAPATITPNKVILFKASVNLFDELLDLFKFLFSSTKLFRISPIVENNPVGVDFSERYQPALSKNLSIFSSLFLPSFL